MNIIKIKRKDFNLSKTKQIPFNNYYFGKKKLSIQRN